MGICMSSEVERKRICGAAQSLLLRNAILSPPDALQAIIQSKGFLNSLRRLDIKNKQGN